MSADIHPATASAHWPAGAELLLSADRVARALDEQAARLDRRLDSDGPVSMVVLMKGGMYPAVELARRLHRPLLFEYVHASRYRGGKTGGDIEWIRFPDCSRLSEQVLLVDDIFDEGYTMAAVRDRLTSEGVEDVVSAVLTLKQHDRGLPRDWVDDHALVVPDRYVFGCGMDLKGMWRQLDGIWAVAE